MPLSDQEFRREKRILFTTRATLATNKERSGQGKNASTIDLSESGARIRFSGLVQPGEEVNLYLSHSPEPCRVVWTAPGEVLQELIVGLQFTRSLSETRGQQVSG